MEGNEGKAAFLAALPVVSSLGGVCCELLDFESSRSITADTDNLWLFHTISWTVSCLREKLHLKDEPSVAQRVGSLVALLIADINKRPDSLRDLSAHGNGLLFVRYPPCRWLTSAREGGEAAFISGLNTAVAAITVNADTNWTL